MKSIVDYVQQELENRTIMAISLHAFGQVFFMPYAGSEKSHHPDFEVHIKLRTFTQFFKLPLICWYISALQGRHGRFLAGKTATVQCSAVAATLLLCCHSLLLSHSIPQNPVKTAIWPVLTLVAALLCILKPNYFKKQRSSSSFLLT